MSTQVAGVLRDPFERPLSNTDIDIRAITNTFAILPGNTIRVTTNGQGEYNFILEPANYAISVILDGRAVYQGAVTITSTTPPATLPELLKQSEMLSELPLNYAEYFQQVQATVKDDADRAQAAANSIGDELDEAKAAAAASQASAASSEQSNQQSQAAYQSTKAIADKFTNLDDAVRETQENREAVEQATVQVKQDRDQAEVFAQQAQDAAQNAGNANNRSVRAPEGETLSELPGSASRANSVSVFGPGGDAAIKLLSEFALLDSNGKVKLENLPSITINDTFTVDSEAAMLALDAQTGDTAIRSDVSRTYILAASPASTLSNWKVLLNDALVQLGKATSQSQGASLVGYYNPASGLGMTLQQAMDAMFVRTIYASQFGVRVDSSDNADALFLLGNYISSVTVPVYVVFPTGTSLVGSQQFASATGKGYSYRPSYFTRNWGDASDMGWFSVHRTNNNIILDMSGWTLKMNSGMKHGSFDPVTGNVYNPSSLPFYTYDYQASQGFLCKIYKAPNTKVINGTTDFSVSSVVWGGYFGDAGYQAASYNWWINQSSGFKMFGHIGKSSAADVLYVGETGDSFSPGDTQQIKGSYFKGCVFQDSGRNILSYTGGANAVFEDCEFWRAGNNASGINGHGSGPASCIDVESEGGKILNLKFKRCKMMHGGDVAVVGGFAQPNDITGVVFDECIMHCETGAQAFINYARNCTLKNSTLYGGISLDTGTKQDPTKVINCDFYNRVDGNYIRSFALSGICDRFENCTVFYEIPTTALPDMVIFNLRGYQQVSGGYGSRARVSNLRIILSGNSNNITHVDMGGFTYYGDATIMVEAGGLTGTKNLAVYMLDSSAGYEGLVAAGSSLVNFGGTMVQHPTASIWFDASVPVKSGGTLAPPTAGGHDVGTKALPFKQGRFTTGILTNSPNGTQYRIRVNDQGSPYAVQDSN